MASGVFVKRHLRKIRRRFGASDYRRHTQPPVENPSAKPIEAKLLKEIVYIYHITCTHEDMIHVNILRSTMFRLLQV